MDERGPHPGFSMPTIASYPVRPTGVKIRSTPLKDTTDLRDNPLWSMYNFATERSEELRIARLRDSMSTVLIISGLFSATVTAFIIESYRSLSPDPTQVTMQYLAQISQQLAASSQGSNSSNPFSQPVVFPVPFEPPHSAVVVNTLWILSLVFSLACALSATMVLSWLNRYMRLTDRYAEPRARARQHTWYFYGLKTSRLNLLVEALPALLHVSFTLFFIGMAAFLYPINTLVASVTTVVISSFAMLYLACTFVPFFIPDSPYHTPLSVVLSFIYDICTTCAVAVTHVLRSFKASRGLSQPRGIWTTKSKPTFTLRRVAPMTKGTAAPSSPQLDAKAVRWLLRRMTPQTEDEVERLIQCIEPFVNVVDEHGQNGKIMFQLGGHLPLGALLASCVSPTDIDTSRRHARVSLCTRALWMLFLKTETHDRNAPPLIRIPHAEKPWNQWMTSKVIFSLRGLQYDPDPVIAFHASCTSAVVACAAISDFCSLWAMGRFHVAGFHGMEILDLAHSVWGRIASGKRGTQELHDHTAQLRFASKLYLLRDDAWTGRLWLTGSTYRTLYTDDGTIHVSKDGHESTDVAQPVEWMFAQGCLHILNQFLHDILDRPFTPSVAQTELACETLSSIIKATFSDSPCGTRYGWTLQRNNVEGQRTFTSLFCHILKMHSQLQRSPFQFYPDAECKPVRRIPEDTPQHSLLTQDAIAMLIFVAAGIDDPDCAVDCKLWTDAYYTCRTDEWASLHGQE